MQHHLGITGGAGHADPWPQPSVSSGGSLGMPRCGAPVLVLKAGGLCMSVSWATSGFCISERSSDWHISRFASNLTSEGSVVTLGILERSLDRRAQSPGGSHSMALHSRRPEAGSQPRSRTEQGGEAAFRRPGHCSAPLPSPHH